jgi:hypothetical protein
VPGSFPRGLTAGEIFKGNSPGPPGKSLMQVILATFGIPAGEPSIIPEAISDSVTETAPWVRDKMAEHSLAEASGNGCFWPRRRASRVYVIAASMPLGRKIRAETIFRNG